MSLVHAVSYDRVDPSIGNGLDMDPAGTAYLDRSGSIIFRTFPGGYTAFDLHLGVESTIFAVPPQRVTARTTDEANAWGVNVIGDTLVLNPIYLLWIYDLAHPERFPHIVDSPGSLNSFEKAPMAVISADGGTILYQRRINHDEVHVLDRITGKNTIIFAAPSGSLATHVVSDLSINADGTVVAFVVDDEVTDYHNPLVYRRLPNQPPVARGRNITIQSGAVPDASRFDAGSYDPEGDPLTFRADPPGPFPLGVTTVTVIVSDGRLASTFPATVTVPDRNNYHEAPPFTVREGPTGYYPDVYLDKTGSVLYFGSEQASGFEAYDFVTQTYRHLAMTPPHTTANTIDDAGHWEVVVHESDDVYPFHHLYLWDHVRGTSELIADISNAYGIGAPPTAIISADGHTIVYEHAPDWPGGDRLVVLDRVTREQQILFKSRDPSGFNEISQLSVSQDGNVVACALYDADRGGPRPLAFRRDPRPAFALQVNFQPAGVPTPTGCLPDTGEAFGDRNGFRYGWNLPSQGATRDRDSPLSPDQRYDTLIHLQREGNPAAVWEAEVPNGIYEVTAVCGDPLFSDSIYRLEVEGVVAVSGTPTSASPWVASPPGLRVGVRDGRLTVRSGAGALNNKLCFLAFRQVEDAGLPEPGLFATRINFQPQAVPPPSGWAADAGDVYGPRNGMTYGWTRDNRANVRVRHDPRSPSVLFDTFNHLQHADNPDAVWEIAVPSGSYEIEVVSGDPAFTDSVYRLQVEGVPAISGTPTEANHWFSSVPGLRVQVDDGKLTVRGFAGAVNNKIDFIDLMQVPESNG